MNLFKLNTIVMTVPCEHVNTLAHLTATDKKSTLCTEW